jgi:hypothetical protein
MKQTAVEYFNQEIKELFNMHKDGEISGKMFHMSRLIALTKAKEMEKEQHGKTWDTALDKYEVRAGNYMRAYEDFDEYYNETFKSE